MNEFIINIPRWEGQILFTYETVSFILLIVFIISGIMMCAWGYKYFHALCLIYTICWSGYAGISKADGLTDNMLLMMVFFVIFVFFGVCAAVFLFKAAEQIFMVASISKLWRKISCFVTPILGASSLSIAVYLRVYRNIPAAVIIFAVFFLAGFLHQRKSKEKQIRFKTYGQLVRMK